MYPLESITDITVMDGKRALVFPAGTLGLTDAVRDEDGQITLHTLGGNTLSAPPSCFRDHITHDKYAEKG